ncbi:MAG: 4-hydroxy-3-methylbut-2-enyl diphosphate reductase [Bacteroidales bacterium]|nr:4-hydroxy-3-methylbut-2-enyl diphosphate reductase [Bacteroidales bacterium]
MLVTIDPNSGFCFGVVYAIQVAERELFESGKLYCLGDIVHNNMEVNRLKEMGLVIIDHNDLSGLRDCKVMIRAHGEPPETYQVARKNNIHLVDASCPIVLNLQQEVRYGFKDMMAHNGQIVIYGKEGHAEVNALKGQTNGKAIVIGDESDLNKIDFTKPVRLYSQTTKSVNGFRKIVSMIETRMKEVDPLKEIDFQWNDSICRQVSNRSTLLKEFSTNYEVIIFVSGLKSSNGLVLYQVCKDINPNTYLVSEKEELRKSWFDGFNSVGVCGATSTPMWLMEAVGQQIREICKSDVSS